MAYTVHITGGGSDGTTSLSGASEHSVDTLVKFDETIGDEQSNQQFVMAIDVSQLQCLAALCDQTITIKTNSSGTPQETITVTAGVPLLWRNGDTALFAGDVTDLFLTNTGNGASARLQMLVGSAT